MEMIGDAAAKDWTSSPQIMPWTLPDVVPCFDDILEPAVDMVEDDDVDG